MHGQPPHQHLFPVADSSALEDNAMHLGMNKSHFLPQVPGLFSDKNRVSCLFRCWVVCCFLHSPGLQLLDEYVISITPSTAMGLPDPRFVESMHTCLPLMAVHMIPFRSRVILEPSCGQVALRSPGFSAVSQCFWVSTTVPLYHCTINHLRPFAESLKVRC